jgi:HAMP domain-containing protein
MALGLLFAYLGAARITGPVRRLADLVERARNGSYTGKVDVDSGDEIGTLAKTFNRLLADLREKEQLIDFLREETVTKKATGVTQEATGTSATLSETAALTAVSPLLAMRRGDLFASRYELLSTLGKGGMGVVYLARDQQLDEEVALKVLRPDVLNEDPTILDRFKKETKLARRITHRNVLRTHDFGETGGTAYISMEYLEGVTLKDLIASKGALPSAWASASRSGCARGSRPRTPGASCIATSSPRTAHPPGTGDLKIMDFRIARLEMKAGAARSDLRRRGGDGNATTFPRNRPGSPRTSGPTSTPSRRALRGLHGDFLHRGLPSEGRPRASAIPAASALCQRPHPAGAGSGYPARIAQGTGRAVPVRGRDGPRPRRSVFRVRGDGGVSRRL